MEFCEHQHHECSRFAASERSTILWVSLDMGLFLSLVIILSFTLDMQSIGLDAHQSPWNRSLKFSHLHGPRRKNRKNVEQHCGRPVDDTAAASLLRGMQHGHMPAHVRRTGDRTAGEHLCGRMSRPRDAPRPSRQRSRRRRPFSANRTTMKRPPRPPPSFRC